MIGKKATECLLQRDLAVGASQGDAAVILTRELYGRKHKDVCVGRIVDGRYPFLEQ